MKNVRHARMTNCYYALCVLALPRIVCAVTVLPLGDSLTRGWGSYDGGGYRTYLAQRHPDFQWHGRWSDGPECAKYHEGWNGYEIDRYRREILSTIDVTPDVALVMLGTNDSFWHHHDPDIGQKMIGDMKQLLADVTEKWPAANVLVSSIPPIYNFGQGENYAEVDTFNAALPDLVASARAHGESVLFVDSRALLSVSDLTDGVHVTDAGYEKIAQAFDFGLHRAIPEPLCLAWLLIEFSIFRFDKRRGADNTTAVTGIRHR